MSNTAHLGGGTGGGSGGALCAEAEVSGLLVEGVSLFDFALPESGWVGIVEALVPDVDGFPPSALLVQLL